MSNKYKLEGETRSLSLGGIGKIIIQLIVIVAGIHLALTIQNWNEEKQTEILELDLLDELNKDIRSNTSELSDHQKTTNEQLLSFGYLLETANRRIGEDTLRSALKKILEPKLYIASNVISESLISSGEIRTIKSVDIIESLGQYINSLNKLEIVQETCSKLIEEQFEPYLVRKQVLSLIEPYDDLDEIAISEQQVDRIIRVVINDREFIDLVYLAYNRNKRLSDAYEELKQSSMKLMTQLQVEKK